MARGIFLSNIVPVLPALIAAAVSPALSEGGDAGDKFGKLRVDTDPPGANVVIITELGKTPLANDYMNPGDYTVEIRPPRPGYLPIAEEITFADGKPVTLSYKLEKPPLLTKKRGVQLTLGTAAAAGFTWAIIEHGKTWSTRQKAAFFEEIRPEESGKMAKKSDNAAIRRTAAVVTGSACLAALQVTIFIWRE